MYDQTSRENIAEKFYDLGAIAMLMRASPELLETGGISKKKCEEIYKDFVKKSQKLKLFKGDRVEYEYYDPLDKGYSRHVENLVSDIHQNLREEYGQSMIDAFNLGFLLFKIKAQSYTRIFTRELVEEDFEKIKSILAAYEDSSHLFKELVKNISNLITYAANNKNGKEVSRQWDEIERKLKRQLFRLNSSYPSGNIINNNIPLHSDDAQSLSSFPEDPREKEIRKTSKTEDFSSGSAEESLSNRSENGQNSLILDEKGKLSIFLNIPYSDIKCPFNRESYLDSGGYGQVHVGFYREEKVAFKTITKLEFLEQFKREVSFMSHFRSTYLLPVLGACFEAPHPCFLMPYAENGSLHQHLENFQFTQEMRFNVTMDITMGLYHLHTYSSDKVLNGVIHADLKPKNVLLGSHFQAQLADFGCSKMTQVKNRKTEDKEDVGPDTGGTLLWMAPEVLEGKSTTKKSDIYGYALILWAIWARETQPNKGMNLGEFANFIVSGGRPAMTADVPTLLAKLIKKCWRQEPSERPNIDFAVKFLREKKDKIFTFFQSVPNSISLEAEVLTEDEPEKEKERPLHL
jgi:hypothetical protein